ncbi:uncharacterized protein LOC144108375 [Amblyomma americanum]
MAGATTGVETLSSSGSPCDDFYAFVCSGWLRHPSFVSTHDTQAALLAWQARSRLRGMARRASTTAVPLNSTRTTASQRQELLVTGDHRTTRSSAKAAALYNECLAASMKHRVDALAVFLRDVGLGFSNHVKRPVELAIKIDLYYNIKTLFDLRRHPTWRRPDGRPLLSMGRRLDLEPWRREREHMRRHETYLEFVQRYVVAIVAHENVTDKIVHDVDFITHQIMSTEESVLAVSAVIPDEDPDRFYAIVPLLAHSRPPMSSLKRLNNLGEVAVGHPAVLAYQDFLLFEIEASDLAAYITWELVRSLGPLADQRLSYGTSEASCFEAVYRLMPYPSVLPYMEELDSYSGWEEAELIFRDVSEAMVSFMKKRGIRLRTTDASFRLLLPTATQLDTFYAELQVHEEETEEDAEEEKRPFLHAYLASLSQIRSKELFSIAHADADADAFYPVPPPRGGHAQVTQDGESRVPLTWLLPPRFGSDVPPLLNYGGFGLELAAALPRGVPLTASWLECLERLEPRLALRGENDAPARLALATEVVGAFVDRHFKVGRRIALPGLEEATEDMLFFVSACAGMCSRSDPEASYRCNLAARNSPLFAQAFNCTEGSYMNPPKRCSYANHTR